VLGTLAGPKGAKRSEARRGPNCVLRNSVKRVYCRSLQASAVSIASFGSWGCAASHAHCVYWACHIRSRNMVSDVFCARYSSMASSTTQGVTAIVKELLSKSSTVNP
jgi:uncharacterized membrane protein YbhN (UPF0104 family)